MADITKCQGGHCKMKQQCYRYTAPTTPQWQSYFVKLPIKEDGTCDEFWFNEKQ